MYAGHEVCNQKGQFAALCKWARPQRCHGVDRQRPSRLDSAVELRLGEKRAGQLQNLIGSAQLPVLSLQGLELLAFVGGHALTLARVHLRLLDPLEQSRRKQPTLGAIDSMAAHKDGYSPRCSCTIRTARSRISGEKRFDFLFMAQFSQSLEPPQNPGRFTTS